MLSKEDLFFYVEFVLVCDHLPCSAALSFLYIILNVSKFQQIAVLAFFFCYFFYYFAFR